MTDEHSKAAEELKVLSQHLVSLAEIVESVFADAVLGLMEGDFSAAREVRAEDYKAHQAWLQAESLCVELLVSGELSLKDVQFVTTAIKIAMWLRLAADESASISQHIRECSPAHLGPDGPMRTLAEMSTLTQSMLSDGIEAFVNWDAGHTQGLHHVFRELTSLGKQLTEQSAEKIPSADKDAGATLLSAVVVAHSLEAIGEYVLEISAHIARLYGTHNSTAVPE